MNKLKEAANAFASSETLSEYENSLCSSSFIAGAEWQKENMWTSVEEALPIDEGTKVICMMKSNGELASGYIYLNNGVPTIELNPDFVFEDYANYEVTHWMPIPEIKKGE